MSVVLVGTKALEVDPTKLSRMSDSVRVGRRSRASDVENLISVTSDDKDIISTFIVV